VKILKQLEIHKQRLINYQLQVESLGEDNFTEYQLTLVDIQKQQERNQIK